MTKLCQLITHAATAATHTNTHKNTQMRERQKYNKWCWPLDADCASETLCTFYTVESFLLESICQIASQLLLFHSVWCSLIDLLNGWRQEMALIMMLSVSCSINVPLYYIMCVWVCESNPNGYWWSFALPLYQHSHLWACMLTDCVCFLLFKCYVSQHFVKCMFVFAGENHKLFRI